MLLTTPRNSKVETVFRINFAVNHLNGLINRAMTNGKKKEKHMF